MAAITRSMAAITRSTPDNRTPRGIDSRPMSKPLPGPGEILALLLDLDVSDLRFEPLAESLSAREQARRRSFKDPSHARRWATGRGLLREVLGAAAGIAPDAVAIRYGEHGKPRIDSSEGLEFNISHSGSLAL